ncbi:hypothetical protein NQZ79_g119 [Umbelopsis isabellina]|nr:hypothetical protein NQZ79_g119 [Umbelopsis isabellina]
MKFTAIAVALTLAATTVSAYRGPVAGCKQVVTVKKGDSCEALAASHDLTIPELISINTGLHWGPGHYCDNLDVGRQYCVKGPNSKSTSTPKKTTDSKKSAEHKAKCAKKKAKKAAALKKAQEDAAKKSSSKKHTTKKSSSKKSTKKSTKKTTKAHTTTKKPTTSTKPSGDTTGPIAHRTIASCKEYHLVTPQDGCESLISKFHISSADFFKWNPGVHHSADHDCDNLDTGKRYCVKA